MNVTDIQCLLTVLKRSDGKSYYTGMIDGIYGNLSRKAIEAFQKDYGGLAVTGEVNANTEKAMRHAVCYGMTARNYVEDTGSFWDEIEFFIREEFRCQCGGKYCNGFPVEPSEKLVRTCDEIRRRLGVPVSIVDSGGSGVRCPRHNAAVGGVANSNHLGGNAGDLHSDKSPEEMARVAEEVMGNTGEIGIYSWGIHVGVNCKYSRFYG